MLVLPMAYDPVLSLPAYDLFPHASSGPAPCLFPRAASGPALCRLLCGASHVSTRRQALPHGGAKTRNGFNDVQMLVRYDVATVRSRHVLGFLFRETNNSSEALLH
ncbi:unnamed protein product [Urochloa humidicola]